MALIRQDTVHAPADPEAFIETSLAAFLDPAEAVERLLGEGALTTFAARDNYVLGALLAHLGASARTAQVATAFAEALQVDAPVAAELLGELVHSPADASRLIQDDFTDAGFVGPPDEPTPPVAVDRATFPLQFASYERMAKLVQFARLLQPQRFTPSFRPAARPRARLGRLGGPSAYRGRRRRGRFHRVPKHGERPRCRHPASWRTGRFLRLAGSARCARHGPRATTSTR